MAMPAMTMPDGSGMGATSLTPVAKVPIFCAMKLEMVEPVTPRGGVRLENEREKFSGGLPAIRGMIAAKFDVNVTFCGGLEPTSDAEPPPRKPLREAFWNVAVRKLPPVAFGPEVIAIVPLYSCSTVPAEVVAVPVLTTFWKVSKAGRGVPRTVPPMFVIWTGIEKGDAEELVDKVVVDPETVAVTTSFGFVWPNWRMVTALLGVASASVANEARARDRIETAFMGSLLSCCRMRM